jgi:hopanoid biosynthesis associated RND transporter like protein HpnN
MAQVQGDFPAVTMRLTGEIAMADEELRTALQGIQFAGLASLLLLALILTFGVRCWSIVCGIFVMLAAGVVWTTLYALLAVGSFNTLSMVFLVMFFGLGVDFALHFCLRVQESLSLEHERERPLVAASADIGTALLLCTLTSSIAFLSFFPTEYRGLADLGVISAGGMLIAFVLTLTLMPAWFNVVGLPRPWQKPAAGRLHFGLDRLSPRTVLAATALIALAAAWHAREVRFDYSVLAMRDKSSESMATLLELQRERLATNYSVSILVAPEQSEKLAQQLLALPAVAAVRTPASRIASRQGEKQALLQPLAGFAELSLSAPQEPALAEVQAAVVRLDTLLSQAAATDHALLESSLAARIRGGLAGIDTAAAAAQLQRDLLSPLLAEARQLQPQVLARPYTLEDLPAPTRARFIAPDGRHLLEVLPAGELDSLDAMDIFVEQVEAVAPNVAGRTVVERGIGQAVVRSFNTAIAIALGGISLVLLFYFREPLTPILILIPLGLTTLFTFAVIELTGLTLNMANILVVPLIFGLGVDTSIHVAHRYHEARDVSEVLQSSTTRAVVLSALTTIGTFFSISFSPHKGAASIGMILTVAIGLMLLVTFVVLPALLAQFEPLDKRRRTGKRAD